MIGSRKRNKPTRPRQRTGRRAPRVHPTRLFVYGTLLGGERNHHLLAGARLVGQATTIPAFQFRDHGGYPSLSPGGEQAVLGEVYEVDDATLAAIDRHEDHPRWHRRTEIELDDGTSVNAYVVPATWVDHRDVLVSGSWRAEQESYTRGIGVGFNVSERMVGTALEDAISRRVPRWADVGTFRARPEAPARARSRARCTSSWI